MQPKRESIYGNVTMTPHVQQLRANKMLKNEKENY
jgi:hypothetical protein